MELLRTVVLLAATITTGLIAGLFYAYACSVMPALRRVDDRTFVTVMQRINVAILNGWFAIGFGGAPLFAALAVALYLPADDRAALPWLVAAFVLSASMLVTTGAVNVPLNNLLAEADAASGAAELAQVRTRFEARWVRWNLVRAVTPTAALGCLGLALLLHGQTG
ncbi:DUF1772 domain-containing protein [Amycolatopsis nigrescens]|uniref:anthrone oxygenase family protein n=1 Tax=Amycolatopsis nigrescens TaxID=381445 RepID=UPI00036AB8D2|nr:DUF1772 domain-containing protein [Amycolatopsis nigrescens]